MVCRETPSAVALAGSLPLRLHDDPGKSLSDTLKVFGRLLRRTPRWSGQEVTDG